MDNQVSKNEIIYTSTHFPPNLEKLRNIEDEIN